MKSSQASSSANGRIWFSWRVHWHLNETFTLWPWMLRFEQGKKCLQELVLFVLYRPSSFLKIVKSLCIVTLKTNPNSKASSNWKWKENKNKRRIWLYVLFPVTQKEVEMLFKILFLILEALDPTLDNIYLASIELNLVAILSSLAFFCLISSWNFYQGLLNVQILNTPFGFVIPFMDE